MRSAGVDCAIGGHAGDATPSARLLASVCDNLVLHPNVVNASDVNEQTENCLYAEGSLICRLLMGTVGLRKVRQNRVLLVTEDRKDAPNVVDNTINCAEGARATLGMDISEVMVLENELFMQTGVADSGRVTGASTAGRCWTATAKRGRTAIALATRITPHRTVELHAYFGRRPNVGQCQAVQRASFRRCSTYRRPTPTMSSEAAGRAGASSAAEGDGVISTTYLFCVLKGLNKARAWCSTRPGCTTRQSSRLRTFRPGDSGRLCRLADVSRGGTRHSVVAVRNNTNLMRNTRRPSGGPTAVRPELL
jgi:hypothetical protein